ncbi:hypothetical protein COX73_01655 [bacterium (Candidatus Gribaldobacteria) CG_4_10_14_0_2_um_filter_36_18]|uniref:Glycosyltransferase 2-like domain-containing protein n=1 Tax=bacterium (Candidatus Gribaldobacteria) CG_4_10_14_0_2_um_filter_36_18 TaxID=2014264 RepID=A0A2M7VKA5_9BACT|nr:MAG: hypothetical protein COX73_01655 [bacterium (Candidatus Gribaldobacteria) CG_4_10_14_0_2_um_filter_36_18]
MQKNKFDIIVGVPTYNEADTIRNVLSKIDLGLIKYFPGHKSLIVNIDSESTDGTRKIFLDTKTSTEKVALSGGSSPRGKGVNIFKFLELAQQVNVPYLCIFDGDIISISESWIKYLLEPILRKEADFVAPIYTHTRIEANAIDHFFNPIIIKWFGHTIRQPIAGEFAMNKKFIEYFLKQHRCKTTYLFGLAVSLVIHAIGGNFKIKEVFLGRKVHKPNFGKISPMFEQMASTTIFTLAQYKKNREIESGKFNKNFFLKKIKWNNRLRFVSKKKIIDKKLDDFYKYSLNKLSQVSTEEAKTYFGVSSFLLEKIFNRKIQITSAQWVQILKHLVDYISNNSISAAKAEQIATSLSPFLFLRLVYFLDELNNISSNRKIEDALQNQLDLLLISD